MLDLEFTEFDVNVFFGLLSHVVKPSPPVDPWEKGFMRVKLFHNFYDWNLYSFLKESSLILSLTWYKNLGWQ